MSNGYSATLTIDEIVSYFRNQKNLLRKKDSERSILEDAGFPPKYLQIFKKIKKNFTENDIFEDIRMSQSDLGFNDNGTVSA